MPEVSSSTSGAMVVMSPETLNGLFYHDIIFKDHDISHLGAGSHEEEGDKEGEDGEHVHDVHPVLEEGPLVGGAGQADEVLQGEPGDADRLYHRQGRVVDCVS